MPKDMSGSLSKNKNKSKDNQPDIKGSCQVLGHDYWISGWKRGEGDDVWYSLAFSPREVKQTEEDPF